MGGYVNTGEKAYIGINAVIRNSVNIGSGSFVGKGAVVTKSVAEHTVVVGNPAREFIRKSEKGSLGYFGDGRLETRIESTFSEA